METQPDVTENVPKEIMQMISQGMSVKDIASLCRTSKRLNKAVCENPNFYRNMGLRDYQDWNYFLVPSEILPIESTIKNTSWLGESNPVYWGNSDVYMGDLRLPGTQNSVKMHDKDYVFHYFMWAPKDHKLVNYNKKFTDEEIIRDIKNREKVTVPATPFGLSFKRRNMILLNMGIIGLMGPKSVAKLADKNLSSEERANIMRRAYTLDKLFDTTPGARSALQNPKILKSLLNPRVLDDLSAEYVRFPDHVSLAFLTKLKGGDKSDYIKLLNKYKIPEQLKMLAKNTALIDKKERGRFIRYLSDLLKVSESPKHAVRLRWDRAYTLPQSESFWTDNMKQDILQIRKNLQKLKGQTVTAM